jgi:hypothetical protein
MVAEIIEVDAQHDRGPAGTGDRGDDIHQLRLAVVAAVGVVDPVRGPLHLMRDDGCPPQTPFVRQRAAIRFFVPCQRRRDRGDGVGVAGQLLLGDCREECAVGAPTERNHDPAQPAELAPKRFDLGVDPIIDGCLAHRGDASGPSAG